MGFIRHHAIVVTCYDPSVLMRACTFAKELGLVVLEPCDSRTVINGYGSFMVCPDGSKEGWKDSEIYDELRRRFTEWLSQPGNTAIEWVEVVFGHDDGGAQITNSAWGLNGVEELENEDPEERLKRKLTPPKIQKSRIRKLRK